MNIESPFRRAKRMAGLEISEIVQIAERATALKKAGKSVVSLATGEPDFPTPPHVIEAAHQAALAVADPTRARRRLNSRCRRTPVPCQRVACAASLR